MPARQGVNKASGGEVRAQAGRRNERLEASRRALTELAQVSEALLPLARDRRPVKETEKVAQHVVGFDPMPYHLREER